MKNILKVTILFCLIVGLFVIPSFASSIDSTSPEFDYIYPNIYIVASSGAYNLQVWLSQVSIDPIYCFYVNNYFYYCSESNIATDDFYLRYMNSRTAPSSATDGSAAGTMSDFNSTYNLYFRYISGGTKNNSPMFPSFSDASSGLSFVRTFIDNNIQPAYNKNENVDEFIANTLISMGVKFDTPAYALSYADDAWDWCIDEDNRDDANAFDEWNIDAFVSYCNAQSNNYLNWYNGYKVSADVTKALGVYIRSNIQLLTGLPSGISSLTASYLPIGHYGSGFNSGATNPSAQTFYPAQTITYFNGEYVNETDDISTSQFIYTPPDVRRFLGYPGSSPTITPSSPTGTGTITDDPNNPDQKNITINFPALDWLADAIKSILDFLRDAFTTLANLLTQLLDAILGLFSDAFEGLTEFGEGFIEFLQTVFMGFSDVLSGFVPTDISTILVTFLALNIGLGLITFVLKGH